MLRTPLLCLTLLLISSFANAGTLVATTSYTLNGNVLLDLYVPNEQVGAPEDTETRYPGVVLMHPGGWEHGNRFETSHLASWLSDLGLVVANIDYSLATASTNKWPAQKADAAQAVWWLKNNAEQYHINPDKILAIGISAGGHLAATLAQNPITSTATGVDSQIHGVISLWGPWDLTTATTDYQNMRIRNLLPHDTLEARALASPLFYISKHTPPILMFHGTNDVTVPYSQSERAFARCQEKGLQHCFFVPLEGEYHGWPSDTSLIQERTIQFVNWWKTL